VAACGAVCSAEDWPQWRGPRRDGIAKPFADRPSWPSSLASAWKVAVGTGHSSPVVAQDRVYLLAREGDDEVVSSFELGTGRRLWRQAYNAPYEMHPAARFHGKGPKSTPVVAAGRLYTLGITGVLSCFEASTGLPVWRKEFSGQFKQTSPVYGTAMSPIVADGRLIAHVGGQADGALSAFDAKDGNLVWAWKGDGPGYASPVVAELGGVRQVVTQTQNHLLGLALHSGELLWKVPLTTPYDQNAVTPVVYGQAVIYSGLDNGVHAVAIARRGGAWTAAPLWANREVSLYMSSPVLEGDFLFGMSHRQKGQFFCLDARTGRTQWLGEGRRGDNAAVVAAGGVLFLLTDDASLVVARKSATGFEPLGRYKVAASPTWAHPAFAGDRIIVKAADSLEAFRIE
jgi:outer membrane protein assembly factor BamB